MLFDLKAAGFWAINRFFIFLMFSEAKGQNMRYSRMLIPTVKEVPADAEVTSHKLMLRAGLMRKLSSGSYAYLPLGWRCLKKIMGIVREEMDGAGAQEILLPAVQPLELWSRTGRDVDYGETMVKFADRHNRWNVLAPTAEEVVTSVAAGEINSYKQLPFNIYQISFKFRDEFRPRFGVVRSREFIMKDSYSFHAGKDSLEQTYRLMYEVYCRIFKRCGLDYVIVEAESGEMGGTGSHQFTVPCDSGEDTIVYTDDGSYAANLEKAAVDPLRREKTEEDVPRPEEVHTPDTGSIEAVCDLLKTRPEEMIKTLIYTVDGEPVGVLVRGDNELNPEKLSQVLGGRQAKLAEPSVIEEVTGAEVGFAGPMGLADKVRKLLIDHSVAAMVAGVTGANKSDYHTKNIVPGRDFPLEGDNVTIADIRYAREGDRYKGKKLFFKQGIEVGQVFRLGTKYSEKLGATFLDENGREKTCIMGCYGIGINRILASAIETCSDESGIIWPITIAPFEVLVTCVNQEDEEVSSTAEEIYGQLQEKGVDVLLDDRSLRGGVKFKDADLIGIPVRITVGRKSVAEGNVEIKLRGEKESQKLSIGKASSKAAEIVGVLKEKLSV